MKRYRILYIVSTLHPSGPINQLYGLIKNLNKDEFEPKILTLSPENSDSKYDDFKKLGIEVQSLGLSRVNMMINGKKEIKKKVKTMNPDIMHTGGIRADIYSSKYFKNYKQCTTVRNYAFDDYPIKFGKIIGNFMALKHINTISKMNLPVSCSYTIADKLKNKHNIFTYVIQNGVDNEYYNPLNKNEKNELKNKLDLNPNKTIFISVGSLIKRKDPLLLLKAFNLAKMSDRANLIMLGKGPLFSACKKFENKSIILEGQVNNVIDYLRASDVFISSSKSEGLPNTVLEAMAAGLPVLLSDIESHKEIFEKNINIGKIFSVGDAIELSNCFKEFLLYDLDNRGIEARKTIKKYFSAKIMSSSYQKLYKKILNDEIRKR